MKLTTVEAQPVISTTVVFWQSCSAMLRRTRRAKCRVATEETKVQEQMPTARRRQLLRELRRLRNERGMTIVEAGQVIGKSEAAYYRLETGRVGRVKELEVRALCQAFGAGPD